MPEKNIEALVNRIHELEKENAYLKTLLDKAGITYVPIQKKYIVYTPDTNFVLKFWIYDTILKISLKVMIILAGSNNLPGCLLIRPKIHSFIIQNLN